MGKKVYLDCGTLEQFDVVVEEYRKEEGGEDINFIFLSDSVQIQEPNFEVWRCRKLDRQLQSYNVEYMVM